MCYQGCFNRFKSTLYFGVEVPEENKLSFSLPPVPPEGAFDVRFEGNWRASETGGEILVQNSDWPLNLQFSILKHFLRKLKRAPTQ